MALSAKWKYRVSCSKSKKKCQRHWNINCFPLFCSFSQTVMVFPICSLGEPSQAHWQLCTATVCSRPISCRVLFLTRNPANMLCPGWGRKVNLLFPVAHRSNHRRQMTPKEEQAPSQDALSNWMGRREASTVLPTSEVTGPNHVHAHFLISVQCQVYQI